MSIPAERPLVLVVDDDPDCCAVAALLLEHQGYRTMRASSGQECLDLVRVEPIELVLLDVMMPGMDGFEVCSLLRAEERTRHLPIILLTARDDMDTRLEGMYHGVSEFLTKPINKHELFARVRAQLHIRNLTQQLETVERSLETARQARSGSRPTGRG
jgi:DNA-binding response OmpR family regulator